MKSKAILLLFVFLLNASAGFSCSMFMEFQARLQNDSKCKCCSGKDDFETSKFKIDSTVKNSASIKTVCCCQISPKDTFPVSKLVPQTNLDEMQPLAAEIYTFTTSNSILDLKAKSNYPDLAYLLPIHDIRIVIQSFQI